MLSEAPKCYSLRTFNKSIVKMKVKGLSMKKNKQITPEGYLKVLDGEVIQGTNRNHQVINGVMTRLSVDKPQ
jgi:hypothetical protein